MLLLWPTAAAVILGGPSATHAECPYYDSADPRYEAFDCDVTDPGLAESPDSISPPLLTGPVHECQTYVTVRGATLGATVRIYIKNPSLPHTLWGTATSDHPRGVVVEGMALAEADVIFATQQMPGEAVSAPSAEVEVEALPNPLPRPSIQPFPVYECGRVLATKGTIPGAAFTIELDDPAPELSISAVATGLWPAVVTDPHPEVGVIVPTLNALRAQYSICGQTSSVSEPEPIVSAGSVDPVPPPSLDLELYEGQRYVRVGEGVYGAGLELYVDGAPAHSSVVWWWGPRDSELVKLPAPLEAGSMLSGVQTLCHSSVPSMDVEVRYCEEVPPPRIRIPQAGDDEIVVEEAVPGARLLVFAVDGATYEEIGDSSDERFRLTRRVRLGEELQVVQILEGCSPEWMQTIVVPCRRFGTYDLHSDGPYAVDHVDVTRESGITLEWDSISAYAISRIYYPVHPVDGGLLRGGLLPIVFLMHGNSAPVNCPSSGMVCGYLCPIGDEYCGRAAYDTCGHEWWLDSEHSNHAAFRSVAEKLASHGIVAVGINANEICGGNPAGNVRERADLYRIHLYLASQGDLDPFLPLSTRIDWSRVMLVGHSRAGEAAVSVGDNVEVPGLTVRGVVALAPTDYRETVSITHVPTLIVLGTRDNDTGALGNAIYDRSTSASMRSVLSIRGANHAFYTNNWSDEATDAGGDDPLTRDAQLRITGEIVLGFANRSFDIDRNFDRVMQGELVIPDGEIATTWGVSGMEPISTYESGSLSTNDMGGSTTVDPGFVDAEIDWCSVNEGLEPYAFNAEARESRALWLRWDASGRTVEEEIPGGLPDRYWLSFRTAQIPSYLSTTGTDPLSFQVAVRDGTGSIIHSVRSEDVGFIPGVYGGFDYRSADVADVTTFARWGSVRIPLGCILEDDLEPDAVRAIALTFDDREAATVAIDDLVLE